MHFLNFLNFRPLNNSLELWIIFSWISLPKGIFWKNKKKLDFSWVSFDSRYSQKMALKCSSIHPFIYSPSTPSILHLHPRDKYELSIDQLPVGLIAQLVRAPAPVSQRSWVRFPFKPEFFQVSSFQPLRLKHLHCDDLRTILSSSAVRIYEFHILMFNWSP